MMEILFFSLPVIYQNLFLLKSHTGHCQYPSYFMVYLSFLFLQLVLIIPLCSLIKFVYTLTCCLNVIIELTENSAHVYPEVSPNIVSRIYSHVWVDRIVV